MTKIANRKVYEPNGIRDDNPLECNLWVMNWIHAASRLQLHQVHMMGRMEEAAGRHGGWLREVADSHGGFVAGVAPAAGDTVFL